MPNLNNASCTYLCSALDVHPDHNPDYLREPQRLRLPGNALHAQGLRGALPSWAERAQAQAEPEGCGHRSHHVQQV